jgi:hypothetical protein
LAENYLDQDPEPNPHPDPVKNRPDPQHWFEHADVNFTQAATQCFLLHCKPATSFTVDIAYSRYYKMFVNCTVEKISVEVLRS